MSTVARGAHQALLQALPMPSLLVDPGGAIQLLNQAAAAWLGAADPQVDTWIGTPISRIAAALQDQDPVTPAVLRAAAEGKPQQLLWDDLQPRCGEPLPGRISIRPVLDDAGGVDRLLVLLPDLVQPTDSDLAAYGVNLPVAVGRAVGNAAHEINNALSLVTGYSELLLGTELEEDVRRDLRNVLAGGQQAGRTAGHLRSFARRLRARQSQLDLNALVSDCTALVRRTFERSGLMLIEDLEPMLPEVNVHVGHVQLVVLSLLIRGLLRLTEKRSDGIVQVRTERAEAEARVTVTVETGTRVEPDRTEKSRRGASDEELRGAGFNLAACRMIVTRQGGHLRLGRDGDTSWTVIALPSRGPDG